MLAIWFWQVHEWWLRPLSEWEKMQLWLQTVCPVLLVILGLHLREYVKARREAREKR